MKKQYEGLDAVLIPIRSGDCIATSGENCYLTVTLEVDSTGTCTRDPDNRTYSITNYTDDDWCRLHPNHEAHPYVC